MSLKVTNLATEKQKGMLVDLGYVGTGNYTLDKLTKDEAEELITELLEEQRLQAKEEIRYTKDNKW